MTKLMKEEDFDHTQILLIMTKNWDWMFNKNYTSNATTMTLRDNCTINL